MHTVIKVLLPLCLMLVLGTVALAQTEGTPDGVPPSQETVCSGLIGPARGLCTAYCEAMDCESDAPQASPQACDTVRSKFITQTGHNPPCENACPCVGNLEGWIEALSGEVTACHLLPAFDSVLLVTDNGLAGSGLNGTEAFCGFVSGDRLTITLDELARCNALVLEKASAAGLECQ